TATTPPKVNERSRDWEAKLITGSNGVKLICRGWDLAPALLTLYNWAVTSFWWLKPSILSSLVYKEAFSVNISPFRSYSTVTYNKVSSFGTSYRSSASR